MPALCTDMYEIRMAASYLRREMTEPATFSLFARKLPPQRGFLVAAGLRSCLERVRAFGFRPHELRYLRKRIGMPDGDLSALAGLRFDCDIWAVPEGTVVGPGEPLLELTASLPVAQLLETVVLNQVTYATAVASKAARCRIAANGTPLVDFAARRTHGLEAALVVARCSAIVGFAGTSYVEAAREFDLRAQGTMAHSYVQAFPAEREAFHAFAVDFPQATVFLVDTYGTATGIDHAIAVVRDLGLNPAEVGVRLDSGDLSALSRQARAMLDDAGMRDVKITASGGLDEHGIGDLVADGAPIDVFGIGTRMGVSWDAPALDSAYKLVAYAGRPVMKLSAGKITDPAAKQVYRGASGQPDLLALRSEVSPADREPLLRPVMFGGELVDEPAAIAAARARFERDLRWLPPAARRLNDPEPLTVSRTDALQELSTRLTRELMPSRAIFSAERER